MAEPIQTQTTAPAAPPPRKNFDPNKPDQNPANQLPHKAAADAKLPPAALPADRLKLAESMVRYFHINVPPHHTPEDLAKETYWVHHARSLKMGDKLDCVSETGQWEVTLRVTAKGDTWARMRCLSVYSAEGRDETSVPLAEQYAITFIPGAGNGHRVMHKESRVIIADKLQSKDDAIRARDAHIEMMKQKG